jgi:hypothetical protein
LNKFTPKYISHDSQLYQNLSETNRMKSWGIDMAESASKALHQSIGHALPYLLLIVAVLVTGIVQQRQIAGRNSSAQINPQQQMIMKLMPIFLPGIFVCYAGWFGGLFHCVEPVAGSVSKRSSPASSIRVNTRWGTSPSPPAAR